MRLINGFCVSRSLHLSSSWYLGVCVCVWVSRGRMFSRPACKDRMAWERPPPLEELDRYYRKFIDHVDHLENWLCPYNGMEQRSFRKNGSTKLIFSSSTRFIFLSLSYRLGLFPSLGLRLWTSRGQEYVAFVYLLAFQQLFWSFVWNSGIGRLA